MEERSTVLFGRPKEMVETLLFLSRKTQFCYERQFLEQFNTSVAVPEGEEGLLKKAVLFFYNLRCVTGSTLEFFYSTLTVIVLSHK